jgi:hypothetical protein
MLVMIRRGNYLLGLSLRRLPGLGLRQKSKQSITEPKESFEHKVPPRIVTTLVTQTVSLRWIGWPATGGANEQFALHKSRLFMTKESR